MERAGSNPKAITLGQREKLETTEAPSSQRLRALIFAFLRVLCVSIFEFRLSDNLSRAAIEFEGCAGRIVFAT
jgi:hypothetical protein